MTKHSHFTSHTWRDDFLNEIHGLTGLEFISFDPTRAKKNYTAPELIFGSDIHMISLVDVVVAYLSNDFSVGGSQEILIAKYLGKPVIALAPKGGIFNNSAMEVAGEIVKDFKHPFVYSTCDVICDDIKEVAGILKKLDEIKPKTISIIDEAKERFEQKHLQEKLYKEVKIP